VRTTGLYVTLALYPAVSDGLFPIGKISDACSWPVASL